MNTTSLKLILITPIFVLLAHALAMLPHEYTHSITAWILGYKTNPFDLTYGGTSWLNLLLLSHMDENVNYPMIFASGHPGHVALIAFGGLGFSNIPLFIISLWLLTKKYVQTRPLLFYFLFLFNLMNLGNFYDYVPIRTFAPHDDAFNFITGLAISPWCVYIIGGYIVAFLILHFFTKTMISAFNYLKLSKPLQTGLMMICVGILFGFYGLPGFFNYGEISHFLSVTSVIIIPGLMIALWPTRAWVTRQLIALKQNDLLS
ncbi:MAG: hypothetical protein ABI597_05075 [Gammaproteobacteria bacterium]